MYRGLMLFRRSKTVSNVTFSSLRSREPDEHSAEPWWPLWSEPELSCGRTSRLQLQQPRQQHTGISFWTWAAETRTFSLFDCAEFGFVAVTFAWGCHLFFLLQRIIWARSAWARPLSAQTASWRGWTARCGALLVSWGEWTVKGRSSRFAHCAS